MRPLAVAVSGRGVIEPTAPVIAADDEGFVRGRAAFTTLRVYGGRPFRLAEHLERLAGSAARIGIPPPDAAVVEALALEAVAASGVANCTLRLTWTPGPPSGPPVALAVVGAVPGWVEELRARGQRLVSLLVPRRSEPWLLEGAKSTSYAVNMAAEAEAKRRGADDAVFVDAEGIILEGPMTTVWWREGTTLVTPSLELGILAGETRAALLELAGGLGYGVEEGAYPLERLLRADEAFTSSSVREVLPVVAVNETAIPRGEAADSLQRALRDVAERG